MRPLILSTLFIFLSIFTQAQHHIHHLHEQKELAEHEMKSSSAQLVVASQVNDSYDLLYHDVFWEIDPAQNFIKGSVRSLAKFRSDQNTIQFDLYDEMDVDSVEIAGQITTFNHSNDLLTINYSQIWNAGEIADVTVYYHGAPASGSFSSNNGWFHQNVQGQDINYTLSQPYGSPSWWPCKHDLNDKVDSMDIRVKVPGNQQAATNGILVSSTPDGAGQIHHWKHRYPIPAYLVAVSVTDYQEYNQQLNLSTGTLNVQNYILPQSYTWAKDQLDNELPEMMTMFDTLFGPYPFMSEKYGHAEFGWGGGMEHQTMSFMGGWSTSLMAHELAHQWFGDKVTCGSWQDIWLNEGFASFCTDIYVNRNASITNSRNYYEQKMFFITNNSGGSVFVYDTTQVSRIFSSRLSYSKGSYVLRMLRWHVGDQAFFQGVRNYLNDPDHAYGYAKTGDFIEHIEQASGKDLSEFASDWIMGEGHVDYTLSWASASDSLHMMLAQTPSHSSVSFFDIRVPITVEFTDGSSQTYVIDHQVNKQYYGIPSTKQVANIYIDQDFYVLARNKTQNEVDIKVIRDEAVKNGSTTTISKQDKSWSINIYPNPSTGTFSISGVSKQTELKVFDLTGKLMLRKQVATNTMLNLERVPKGMYLLEIVQNGRKEVRKLIKDENL